MQKEKPVKRHLVNTAFGFVKGVFGLVKPILGGEKMVEDWEEVLFLTTKDAEKRKVEAKAEAEETPTLRVIARRNDEAISFFQGAG